MRLISTLTLCLSIGCSALVAACQGCQKPPPTSAADDAVPKVPTLRLYIVSTVAGALEPCGCSKDQLGGIDHLAAYLSAQKDAAPNSLVLGAGPLLFQEPVLDEVRKNQAEWKAEAMANAASKIQLAAWTPGANDWAAGADRLEAYRKTSGAILLGANLKNAKGITASEIKEVNGIKVGLVGVATPKQGLGAATQGLAGIEVSSPVDALKTEIAALKNQGAQILVGIAAMPRGEALRLVDQVPELNALVVGKSSQKGDANDALKPAVLIGSTVVVESANHLQTVAVLDLYVRGAGDGVISFADAGGVSKAEELVSISGRIRDLENRINGWEDDKDVDPKDVAARKADLETLRTQKAQLEKTEPPASGSFFRYTAVEVREGLGKDEAVGKVLSSYYKRVNNYNREAFKDRKPQPAKTGEAAFIGVEECRLCHDEAAAVWDKTGHANAYETLEKDHKEFNLDCVGCHVTGYDRPGGSTVTFVKDLKDVGCETCHGPGSLHAADPDKAGLIVLKPEPQSCVSECHHPPHVEGFDPVAKMKLVLGPGHGE